VIKNGEHAVEKWRSGRFALILVRRSRPHAAHFSDQRADGYPNTCHGWYLRDKGDPLIGEAKCISGSPWNTSDGRAAHPVRYFERSTSLFRVRSSVIITMALTTSSSQSDRVAALAAGCNDFLIKPISLEWLDDNIIDLLRHCR